MKNNVAVVGWHANIDAMPLDTVEDMSKRLLYANSHETPDLITSWFWEGRLDDEACAALLSAEWSGTDVLRYHRYDFLCMFDSATRSGPVTDDPTRIPQILRKKKLRIYRGACLAERNDEIGLSWTTDKTVALGFLSDRFHQSSADPILLSAQVSPAECFGFFFERGESEVVVDPDILTDITIEYRPRNVR